MSLNTTLKDLKKPINTISLLMGLAGILLGLLTYVWGYKLKRVSYLVCDPVEVKSGHDTLFTAIGYIWNSGDLTISRDDVRKNIVLYVVGAKQILSCKILEQVDDIADFELKIQDPL